MTADSLVPSIHTDASKGGDATAATPVPLSERAPGTRTSTAMHPNSAPTQEAWAQECSTCSPTARLGAMMAYDPSDGYVVLYGGETQGGSYLSDTWTYLNGQWTELSPTTSPPARSGACLAWDTADNELVLFGGGNYYGTQDSDTWTFIGGQWTQDTSSSNTPGARLGCALAYDASDSYLMMYGGYTTATGGANGKGIPEYGDLWEFKSGQWTSLPMQGMWGYPPPLSDPNLVFDAYDNYIVMFGGKWNANEGYFPYTWEYNAGNWYNLSSGSVQPPMYNCGSIICAEGMTYDAKDRIVVYETAVSYTTEETWLLKSGVWTQDPGTAPSARVDEVMAYDAADGYALLFSGWSPAMQDGWTFPGPLSVTVTPSQYGVDIGQNLVLTANVVGGAPSYTYVWSNLPAGCSPANQNSISCQPTATGTSQINVQVTDSGSRQATSPALPLTVSADPTVATPTGSEPFSDVNEPVTFSTSVSGGPGTYVVYNWNQLPQGCASQNTSSVPCTPAVQGSYHVQVTVTDGNHDTQQSTSIWYQVLSNPSVTLAENRSVIDLGQTLRLWANPSGGSGVYSYWYQGLPCGTHNASVLPCWPNVTGTFTVKVTVNDTVGGTATSGPISFVVDADPVVYTTFLQGGPSAYVNEYLTVDIHYGSGTPNYRPCIDAPGSVTGGWNCGIWQGGSQYAFGFWYTASGSYTITTSLEDSAGWNVTYSFTENVYAALSSGGVSLPSVTDQGMTVTGQTTIQNGIPGFNLWWNDTSASNQLCTASSAVDGLASCSFTVGWTGTHNVELTVRDSGWDSYFANLTLGANPALHGLGLNASVGAFSARQAGTLQDEITATTHFIGAYQGGTGPVTVTWSFNGSVTMGTGTTLSYSWAHSAIYTVTETVQDSLGDVLSGTLLVQVNPPASGLALSSHLTSLDTGIGDNLTANFTGGLGPFTFAWNFGDGTQASGGHPWTAHAWAAAGTYSVTATLTDAAGVQSSTSTQVLVLTTPSVGSFSASSASATVHAGGTLATYENATVQFSGEVQGGSGPYTFSWSSNGTVLGSVRSVGPWYNLTFTWRATGIFDITFTVTDMEGQSSSAGAQVIIRQDGIGLASISAQRSTLDAGVADNLTVTFQGGVAPYTFGWILGDGSGTRTSQPWIVHTWTGARSYLVSVDIQDSLGATLTVTTTITVNPALSAACSPSANSSVIWTGDPVSLALTCVKNGTNPYSFDWSFGDGNVAHGVGSQVPYTWSTPGNYSVRATINDSGGGSVESGTLHVEVVAFTQTVPVVQSGTYAVLSTTPSSGWKTTRISVTLTTFDPYGAVTSWRMAPAGSDISSAGWRAGGTILLTLNVSQANATQLFVLEVSNSLGRTSAPYSLAVNLTSLFVSSPGGPGSNGNGGMDLGAEVLLGTVVVVAAVMAVLVAWALSQRKKRGPALQSRGASGQAVSIDAGSDPVVVGLMAHLMDHPTEEDEALVSLVASKTHTENATVRTKLDALVQSGVVTKETGSGDTRYSLSDKGSETFAALTAPVIKQGEDDGRHEAEIEAALLEAIDESGEVPVSRVVHVLGKLGVPPNQANGWLEVHSDKFALKPGGKDGTEPMVFRRPKNGNGVKHDPSAAVPSFDPGGQANNLRLPPDGTRLDGNGGRPRSFRVSELDTTRPDAIPTSASPEDNPHP